MAGNPLLANMTKQQGDPRFGQFGAGGTAPANPYGQQPYGSYQQGQYGQTAQYGQQPYGNYQQGQYGQQPTAEELNQMYGAPSAGPADTNRLTINDVIVKTAMNLGILVVAAVISWYIPALMYVGAIGGLALGLVNAFKKKVSPALVMTYSFAEGLLLGGFSRIFEGMYPGIVVQAVLATVVVFATVLALYTSGKIRATPKLTRFFMVAIISYTVFVLINFVSAIFFDFNMRTDMSIMGIPLGLFIGLFAVLLATYSLLLDFTNVSESVKMGVPERESWRLAFGLVVSLVWLYVEILRIIAIVRSMADN